METTMPNVASLEAVCANDVALRLYRYWTEKRGERMLPSRGDLDLLDFTYALTWVSLVDVMEEPRRFRYRLVSTGLTERLGYEMTGRYVEDLPDSDMRRYVEGLYGRCVDQLVPLYEKSTRIHAYKLWLHEALVLPLSQGSEKVEMLMIYRATHSPTPLPTWAQDGTDLHWV